MHWPESRMNTWIGSLENCTEFNPPCLALNGLAERLPCGLQCYPHRQPAWRGQCQPPAGSLSPCRHGQVYNILMTMNLETLCQNERAQTMTTNCEIITKWHDVFLMWDPAKYDNITDTRLPWEEVWTPDIVLYNAAGDGEQGREMRTLIQVSEWVCVPLFHSAPFSCSLIDLIYCWPR